MMMMMMMMMSTPLSPLRLFLVFFRQSLGVVVVVVVVVVPTPPLSSLSLLSLSLATASTSRSEEETKRVVFRGAKNNEEDVFCVLLSRSKIFPIERILPSSLLKRGGLGEKTTTRLQKRGAPPLFLIILRGEEHKSSPREPSRSTEEVAPFDTHRS